MRVLTAAMWKIMQRINYYRSLLNVHARRRIWIEKHDILNSAVLRRLSGVEETRDGLVLDKTAKLFYDMNSDVGKQLFAYGAFEKSEIAFFAERLSKIAEPVILDVGANIGVHTVNWAKTNHQMRIYAFEPSPITCELLNRNIKLNKIAGQVRLFPLAVSNITEKRSFYHTEDDAYSSLKDTRRKAIRETFEIQTITIDDFIRDNQIDRIDFVKIDVEGFESEVIEGAVKTLSILRPDLFVEIYKGTDSNATPDKTIQTLIDIGYHAYHFIDGKLSPFSTHDDKYYNYFFTFAP
jgi:FkbM family methyltransferase